MQGYEAEVLFGRLERREWVKEGLKVYLLYINVYTDTDLETTVLTPKPGLGYIIGALQ